jgi:hypothetical protein
MNPANLIIWPTGSAVWALDAWIWWAGTVVEENEDFCVVRLVHGISLTISIDNLKLRDPVRNDCEAGIGRADGRAPTASSGRFKLNFYAEV